MSFVLTRHRIAHLLQQARGKRVAVIGDAMLDVYLAGDVDRISPEAPVPVVRVKERRSALGGAANVAQNLRALGCDCDLVAAVGDDAAGLSLRNMLSDIGADTRGLLTIARPTTVKTRIVARSQQLLRVDEEEDADIAGDEASNLLSVALAAGKSADAVVFEDYNKGVLGRDLIAAVLDQAVSRQIPTVVDPKHRNFFSFAGATIFKPNRRELSEAIGVAYALEPDDLPSVAERLKVENLLVTLGERGMALISRHGEIGRIATVAREVYDVVGAGDTVTAYLAAMLSSGAEPLEAALIANIAAGIEVGKLGAQTVTPAELLEYVDTHQLHA